MCGISGYISKKGDFKIEVLKSINEGLQHRGPDEDGYYAYQNLGIGHKRLSIIDLTSGKQPMHNDNGQLSITYNGELYNFKELRNTLSSKGLKFHTDSDTEVVLKAYEYYGNKCVHYFRGMFSFAIVNKSKNELFIARDHLGIKPLVYYQDNKSFAFSSEIRALTALPDFNKEIDYYALDQYLSYQYIPAPRTIFRKVKKLNPGHFMVVGFDGEIKSIQEFWDLKFKPDNRISEEEWVSNLESEIRNSVKLHTVSDVSFGAFLSGGIDSTLIVKYMTEVLGEGINTYTIGFKDSDVSESHFAEKVALKYKTKHTSLTLEGNALEILPDLVRHYGEPFGDFSSVPTFYVSELAAKNVKMVLSGDGADEALAGYSHYPRWLEFQENHNYNVFSNNLVKKWYPLAHKLFPKRYPEITKPGDLLGNYLPFRSRMQKINREKLWKPEYRFLLDVPNELLYNYEDSFRENGSFGGAQYFDIKTFMPGSILTKVDIASMMNSLEVRTPLTDKNIFEFAATVPQKFLLNKRNNSWNGKHILKQLLKSDFQDDFIYRKKQGFEIPLEKWLFEGSNYQIIRERLLNTSSILNSLFDQQVIEQMLIDKKPYDIWLLLVLDEWFNQLN